MSEKALRRRSLGRVPQRPPPSKSSLSNVSEEVTRLVQYFNTKGRFLGGDEKTEAYSDEEGSEDDAELRRKRREATALTKAVISHNARKVLSDSDLGKGSVIDTTVVSPAGRAGLSLVDVMHADEDTFRRAREIDREHHSQLTNDMVSYRNKETQTPVVTPGYTVTIDTRVLIASWLDSKRWTISLVVGLIFGILGVVGVLYSWSLISPYLF